MYRMYPPPSPHRSNAIIRGMAGYSGTPLARKLGVTQSSAVLLDGAPEAFAFGPEQGLPVGVTVRRWVAAGPYDVILCFCTSADQLARRWALLHPRTTQAGALWIAWPKKSAGVPTDLNEN